MGALEVGFLRNGRNCGSGKIKVVRNCKDMHSDLVCSLLRRWSHCVKVSDSFLLSILLFWQDFHIMH